MNPNELKPFGFKLAELARINYPKQVEVTKDTIAMFFRALQSYSLSEVTQAMDAHISHPTECKFWPQPGQLIGHIEVQHAFDGRPGPEEAWAIALEAADEDATVVWTAETALAWGVARVVLRVGDKVGAHMACWRRPKTEPLLRVVPTQN